MIGSDIILAKNNIAVENILTNPNDIIGKLNNTYLTVILNICCSCYCIYKFNCKLCSFKLFNKFFTIKLSLKSSGLIVIYFYYRKFLAFVSQIGVLSIIDTVDLWTYFWNYCS